MENTTNETKKPSVVDLECNVINEKIATFKKRKQFLLNHQETLEALGVPIRGWDFTIDFDNLKHEQIIEVIQAFPGKWTKEYHDTTIDYTLSLPPFTLRCWRGAPPPNCKLVEEQVVVPSSYVAEHTITVKKLVCTE